MSVARVAWLLVALRGLHAVAGRLAALTAGLRAWRRVRRRDTRALRELASMNTRELRDIGIEAADLHLLGVHPFDDWPR